VDKHLLNTLIAFLVLLGWTNKSYTQIKNGSNWGV